MIARPARPRTPGPRGWPGRGGGSASYVSAPVRARGTSTQVCGLYPMGAGATLPTVGVPLGRRLPVGNVPASGTVCADPHSWYARGHLIPQPSQFVLGLPGLGKSTLVRRQVIGLADYGVIPMVLGDLRPDYVDTIRALGGQVITLGRSRGALNPLDVRYAQRAAERLTGRARETVLADAHGRRTAMVASLLTILRRAAPTDREEAIVDRALRVLDDRWPRVPWAPGTSPVPRDLLQVIREAPEDVRLVAIDRGDRNRYEELTESLEASLVALHDSDRLGRGTLARHTSDDATPTMDRPVVFDISSVPESEHDLAAALLLSCWSVGFGQINVAHALADAGLEPRRTYLAVQDELWRPLRVGHGMPGRIDALGRLNRRDGVAEVKITHTMSDLELADPADTKMARGLVERSGMVVLMGLPGAEVAKLREGRVLPINAEEERLLTSWTTPPSWDGGQDVAAPGVGNFLVKVGDRPGIPGHLDITPTEKRLGLHDTSKLWEHVRQVVPA